MIHGESRVESRHAAHSLKRDRLASSGEAASTERGRKHFENKKVPLGEKLFCVDPAGLAPASLLVKGNMLLYTPQARIHKRMLKRKEPFRKDSFR